MYTYGVAVRRFVDRMLFALFILYTHTHIVYRNTLWSWEQRFRVVGKRFFFFLFYIASCKLLRFSLGYEEWTRNTCGETYRNAGRYFAECKLKPRRETSVTTNGSRIIGCGTECLGFVCGYDITAREKITVVRHGRSYKSGWNKKIVRLERNSAINGCSACISDKMLGTERTRDGIKNSSGNENVKVTDVCRIRNKHNIYGNSSWIAPLFCWRNEMV